MTHPAFRLKLEAIGFGIFIPVFFVAMALAVVRGLPALLYRPLVGARRAAVAGLFQATSLPFIVAATAIGRDLDMIGGAESAELIAAGLLSVLLFPLAGSLLLRGDVKQNGGSADIPPKQVLLVAKEET